MSLGINYLYRLKSTSAGVKGCVSTSERTCVVSFREMFVLTASSVSFEIHSGLAWQCLRCCVWEGCKTRERTVADEDKENGKMWRKKGRRGKMERRDKN